MPRQIFRDRVSGRVSHGTRPSSRLYLSSVEEKELENFLMDVAKASYGES